MNLNYSAICVVRTHTLPGCAGVNLYMPARFSAPFLQIFEQASEQIITTRTCNQRACKYSLNTLMNLFQSSLLSQVG